MYNKLKIGEKIKRYRTRLGMTQRELCGDRITRNMLSLIENGSALPSLDTVCYLTERLGITPAHLFSEEDDDFIHAKQKQIKEIKRLYSAKKYSECIDMIDALGGKDDELNYIAAHSLLKLGKQKVKNGELTSGQDLLIRALKVSEETVYDTSAVRAEAPLYIAVAMNIHSPLLEFDQERYYRLHKSVFDYDFFKYVTMDPEYEFENPSYKKHLSAKLLLKRYAYSEAIVLLTELEDTKDRDYDAYMLFGVYTDLENAYRQIGDFENAYRYSAKRMSLINGFKS
ncbi:MAG: helix-turn-helix transcriptional regulator [Ruminococcaceae bacterium]|nr:helix-turn-helix transcriptional regulator [Oscillospiraceae bacterium]